MFDWVINVLSTIFFVLLCVITPFVLIGFGYFIYYRYHEHIIPIKAEFERENTHTSFLKRVFIDFPKRFVLDRLTRNPNEFGYYGFHLFVGEQGSGKTVATVDFIQRIKAEYPLCKIATNFAYKDEDSQIEKWQDLVFNNNGIYGQVDVIDEVQNWFSSNQSKDFPPEMIQEITQQRKQRKIMIGTTQRFERMAKPLREQVNYLYYPSTIAGCLTMVKVVKPNIDSEGQIDKLKPIKRYFFIHSDKIRNAFDTYHKIKKQAEAGYQERVSGSDVTLNNFIISNKRKK